MLGSGSGNSEGKEKANGFGNTNGLGRGKFSFTPGQAPTAPDECTVLKRDGLLVPFRRDRIERAIELAFRATHEVPESDPLPKDDFSAW